jgi:hypothetical protein
MTSIASLTFTSLPVKNADQAAIGRRFEEQSSRSAIWRKDGKSASQSSTLRAQRQWRRQSQPW